MTAADQSDRTKRFAIPRAVVAATAGGFVLGYGLSVIGGAVDAIGRAFDASAVGLGLVVTAALLGSVLGACSAERLPGRWLPYAAAAVFVVTAIGSGAASTIWELACWRFGTGLAIGVAAWLAPAHPRGRLGSVRPFGPLLGVLTALLVDYLLAAAAGGAGEPLWLGVPAWRWMLLALVIPALFGSALVCWVERAPRGQGVGV